MIHDILGRFRGSAVRRDEQPVPYPDYQTWIGTPRSFPSGLPPSSAETAAAPSTDGLEANLPRHLRRGYTYKVARFMDIQLGTVPGIELPGPAQ